MNRSEAMDYLTDAHLEIATEAGFDENRTLIAYKTVIDHALRLLDYTEGELSSADTTSAETPAYLAALDYYALSRFARVFAIRTDTSVSGALSVSQSQAFTQVSQLVEDARQRLVSLGVDPAGESMQIGRINLDFLEPAPVEL